MQYEVDMLNEEIVIASILLQRFFQKQESKGVQVVKVKNIGTILIVVFILAMKLCRDDSYRNKTIANMFKIPSETINQSELGFLRMIDFDLNVEYGFFDRDWKLPYIIPLISYIAILGLE